jgi:hypothetical protein
MPWNGQSLLLSFASEAQGTHEVPIFEGINRVSALGDWLRGTEVYVGYRHGSGSQAAQDHPSAS